MLPAMMQACRAAFLIIQVLIQFLQVMFQGLLSRPMLASYLISENSISAILNLISAGNSVQVFTTAGVVSALDSPFNVFECKQHSYFPPVLLNLIVYKF